MKIKFDYLQEALEKGYWTQDGRFCILGIRQNENHRKEALVYKDQTMVIMWQDVYEPKRAGGTYVNKAGEHVYIDNLVDYKTLKQLEAMPTWRIEKNIE